MALATESGQLFYAMGTMTVIWGRMAVVAKGPTKGPTRGPTRGPAENVMAVARQGPILGHDTLTRESVGAEGRVRCRVRCKATARGGTAQFQC